MKRLTLTLGFLALAATLAACSGTSAAPAPGDPATGAPSGNAVTVTAKDLAFTQAQLAVPAEEAFDLVFDNQDGAPHNVAISSASGASVFKGDIVTSTKVTYKVPALAAGTYSFICEVHPDMKGTITAQ